MVGLVWMTRMRRGRGSDNGSRWMGGLSGTCLDIWVGTFAGWGRGQRGIDKRTDGLLSLLTILSSCFFITTYYGFSRGSTQIIIILVEFITIRYTAIWPKRLYPVKFTRR